MSAKRAIRVASLLREVLSEILSNHLKDPAVGQIIVSRVSVSDDLKIARVHFHQFGKKHDQDKSLEGLRRASGFVRTEVSRRTSLRFVPALEFVYDDSLDYAEKIDDLLKKAALKDKNTNS